MNKYVIIADSHCDLSKELRDKHHVEEIIKAHVILPNGEDRLNYSD